MSLPNDKYPAKVNKEIPEETVQVLPGSCTIILTTRSRRRKARFPEERVYLQAKIDHEARKYLAKAALYAAAEYRAQDGKARDRKLAVLACVIMLRFGKFILLMRFTTTSPAAPSIFSPLGRCLRCGGVTRAASGKAAVPWKFP